MKNLLLMFFLFRSNFELNQVRHYREQTLVRRVVFCFAGTT